MPLGNLVRQRRSERIKTLLHASLCGLLGDSGIMFVMMLIPVIEMVEGVQLWRGLDELCGLLASVEGTFSERLMNQYTTIEKNSQERNYTFGSVSCDEPTPIAHVMSPDRDLTA